MDDKRLIQEVARRAWKLIRDEAYQNKHQPNLNTKGTLQKVRDISALGTLECPIGVNGAYGEIAYLSLLRTEDGTPLAFHRIGSVQSPVGIVDKYELLSTRSEFKSILYLDPYYKKRSQQAPKGFRLAKDFFPGNPIFGCNFYVSGFPTGIAQHTREMQKNIYGAPLPVEALREMEARFTQQK